MKERPSDHTRRARAVKSTVDSQAEAMKLYYDARANEYEEVYAGHGPAIPDPSAYARDVKETSEIVSAFATGQLIDIGCGTGFWLPHYAFNCSHITLLDQSEKMLSECRRKAEQLGVLEKCHFVHADFFTTDLSTQYTGALTGFLLSHLSFTWEARFFARLESILKPRAPLLLIDSAWSSKRRRYRQKEGIQKRSLRDGRTFLVYKRYFDRSDIGRIFTMHNLTLNSLYFGDVFFAALGNSTPP